MHFVHDVLCFNARELTILQFQQQYQTNLRRNLKEERVRTGRQFSKNQTISKKPRRLNPTGKYSSELVEQRRYKQQKSGSPL